MPCVSVIVPVYNAAPLLARCLESLSAQTLRDFEVVCVDDGSTDGCAAILAEQAARDSRVRVITQPNRGTFVARKVGVAAAQGRYLCFVDPDDSVRPGFLEKLTAAADRGAWDIVQCGVELEETRARTEQQRAVSERYFNPDAPTLRRGGLLTRAYLHKRIGWNLIFRLFRTELVKAAFAELPDVDMINETDAAAFFPIARLARRFRRIRDRLYVYRYGDGISTRTSYTLADYVRTLGKFDFVRAYAPRVAGSEAEAAFVVMAARMAENARKSAFARIADPALRQQALALLAKRLASAPRAVTHVGIHYFNLRLGGVQRVILQTVARLKALGLKVTLFLEDRQDGDCLEIPAGVPVRWLPRSLGNLLPEEKRIPLVAAEMRAAGIDCWYDHAVFAPGFVTNVMTAKGLLGLPVVAHYHTVFTAPLRFRIHPEYFELQSHWLRLADAVLTLGRADAAYFRSQAVNAVVMPNALPDTCRAVLAQPLSEPAGRRILWCGRASWEKHPEDARRIAGLVQRQLPEVELDLLTNEPDPYPFFARASVFLATSEMEGFSMASAEALAHGLPIVAYRLDNLDLYRDNPAVIQVPQGDVEAAAAALVAILRRADDGRLREQARASVAPFAAFDPSDFWTGLQKGAWPAPGVPEPLDALATRLLDEGLAWRAAHPKPAQKEPVTLRRILRYIRDNGFWYTVGKALARWAGHW